MIDRPLVVSDATVARGERLRSVRPNKDKQATLDTLYRDWIYNESHKILQRVGPDGDLLTLLRESKLVNAWAFFSAIRRSCPPRRPTHREKRLDMAGLYHWYMYAWLPKRYGALWRRIHRVTLQITKANRKRYANNATG